MKKLFLVPALCLISTLAFASADLQCQSYKVVDGAPDSNSDSRIELSAKVVSNTELNGVRISGAYVSDQRNLTADPKYRPRLPQYQNMNRFPLLEDAWCWFTPMMPKNLSEIPLNQKFNGFIKMICEEGVNARTYLMACVQK